MPILGPRWERLIFSQQLSYVKRVSNASNERHNEQLAAMSLEELRNALPPEAFAELCDMFGS